VLAERSLADFVRQAWPILEPKTRFEDNWHIDFIAEHLEAVAVGDITRLIINVPPRSGKSLLASIFFPCWRWIHNPAERFMFASYSSILSNRHSIDRRTVLTSPWYQRNWGHLFKFAYDLNKKGDFANTKRGHMIATSVGGSATGRGGNFLLVDDLINPDQANSDVERENGIRWFDESFCPRLDDQRTGRIIAIEQRTHMAVLTGHLLAQGGWTHISLPAEAQHKTIIVFPRSRKTLVREEGDLLWPARLGRAELENAKLRLASYAYAAQYLQNPVSREGNVVKIEWLSGTYRTIPPRCDSIILALDTAYKTGASNDYSAAVVIGTLRAPRDGCPPGHYLVDAWRDKVEFAALKRKIVELHSTWRCHAVLVEDAASGQSLIQELRSGTTLPIKPIKPDRDRYERVTAITPVLERRGLLLPETAWWREPFITELTSFPNGVHDDWCDALAMALNYLREETGAAKWIAAGKLQVAAAQVHEGATVEQAAARVGISVSEFEDYLDGVSGPSNTISQFGTHRARNSAKSDRRITEVEIDSLLREWMSGNGVQWSQEDYEGWIRQALLDYATLCDAHGDKMATMAHRAVADLDRRFNFSA
jgi:predicted phage terminase large subunit-like protein